jgi:hypothetical protein
LQLLDTKEGFFTLDVRSEIAHSLAGAVAHSIVWVKEG